MKALKIVFFLVILILLVIIGYQNHQYFLTDTALHIDFKISSLNYTTMALPNWAYWGICLVLGILLAGFKGFMTAFRLGREIKAKNVSIQDLNTQVSKLKSELEVFTHDPYIKKKTDAEAENKDSAPADNNSKGSN